jgi:S1-C subfamily serine protease
MPKITLPQIDLQVSTICMGIGKIGTGQNPDGSFRLYLVWLKGARVMLRSVLSFCTLLVLFPRHICAEEIPLGTVEKCKKATVLVRIGEAAEGTAFHIGQGLFVTNAHVTRSAGNGTTPIRLVMNAGEEGQRVLDATLFRSEDETDLAVLKCTAKNLPEALELGASASLVETMSVAAFGFPFGTALAFGKTEFPSISVSLGRITALRKAEGKMYRIQLDASLNPGNSGGPVISNTTGRVIGIVQAGVPGASLNFAIPVDRLRQLLFGSTLLLRSPALKPKQSDASTLIIEQVPVSVNASPVTVTFRLIGDEDTREFQPTPGAEGNYTVTAPLVASPKTLLLRAEATLPEGTISETVKDCKVQIESRTLNLSQIREIRLVSRPGVTLTSGEIISGALDFLNTLEMRRNGKWIRADFRQAKKITLAPIAQELQSIAYEIVVKSEDVLLARQKGYITPQGIFPEIVPQQKAVAESGGTELPQGVVCVRFRGNGHDYAVLRTKSSMPWEIARQLAARMKYKGRRGHLVTITTPEEAAFVSAYFQKPPDEGWYVGGYQDTKAQDYSEPGGGWRWVTGEPFRYARFAAGEPNDTTGGSNVINLFADGTWNDCADGDANGFIIEFE